MFRRMIKQYRIKRCQRALTELEAHRARVGRCAWTDADIYVARKRLQALTEQ